MNVRLTAPGTPGAPVACAPPVAEHLELFLENQLCFALYAASLAMTKLYRPLLADAGITYPQYIVLLALWQTDGMSVGALGAAVALDSGTLTPLLKRMEQAGLLVRQRTAEDERKVIVWLTARGSALHGTATGICREVTSACGLTPQGAHSLTHAMSALRRSLSTPAKTVPK